MRWNLAVLTLWVALLSGCSLLCPQPGCVNPSVLIFVTDAETNAPLDSVIVEVTTRFGTTALVEQQVGCPSANCRSFVHNGVDVADFTVRAEGYDEAALQVPIPRDACDRQVTQRRDVALRRLGSGVAALVSEGPEPDTCGR